VASIDSRPASGTRDLLGPEVVRRERVFATVREVFARHGFEPLDTPAFERLEVLEGKYGEEGDQLIFKILRRGEHERTGEADLALRYDLTVPLARVVAQYSDEIVEPYKRYQISPVWRADRPGKGRFREFIQCDVDVVGTDARTADAEVIVTVADALAALGIEGYEVQLNSRQALHGLMEAYAIPAELEGSALVALDKLDKIGPDGVLDELADRGVPADAVTRLGADLRADDVSDRARRSLETTERGKHGLAEVDEVLGLVQPGLRGGSIRFAPLLARGLDYYTGPIVEFTHPDAHGSIAAGGRYDDLVGMFTNRDIPATGCSIGVERVLQLVDEGTAADHAPDVLVTVFDEDAAGDASAVARRLREAGLDVDLYLGSGRLGKQLRYADRRGIRYCVVRGPDELAAGQAAVKDLETGEQVAVGEDDLAEHLRGLLSARRDDR
jgi:histidyl-tRNA synthetase